MDLYTSINFHSIREIESLVLKNESKINSFLPVSKRRLLNVKSLRRSIYRGWNPGVNDFELILSPRSLKTALNQLYKSFFYKKKLPISADIVRIKNNLSLFYFDKGIRLKLLLNQGSRTSQQIKNEIIIRKKIENSPLCIPEILESNLEKTPFWFVDQLVMGEKIQWNHPKASQILIEILTNMWGFYQSTGIVWETLRNRGIDITKVVDDFCILKRKDKDIFGKTNFDLNKIRSFANKFVSSSLIHGDLSIGNVIVLGNKNYIIDWELARNDFIIRDFYKTLKARWDLYNELNEIMNKGIENYFGKDKQQVLNLEDQYLLEQFLSAYARANNVYARYAPWTDILDNCDKIRS